MRMKLFDFVWDAHQPLFHYCQADYSVKRTNPTSLWGLSWPLLDLLIGILEGNRQI